MKPFVKSVITIFGIIVLSVGIISVYYYFTSGKVASSDNGKTTSGLAIPKPLVNADIPPLPKNEQLEILSKNKEEELRAINEERNLITQPAIKPMIAIISPPKNKPQDNVSSNESENNSSQGNNSNNVDVSEKNVAVKERVKVVYVKEKNKSTSAPQQEESNYNFIEVKPTNAARQVTSEQSINEETPTSKQFSAVVLGEQNVSTGDMVRVRLVEAVSIDGVELPRNTIFRAKVSLGADRLMLEAKSIPLNGKPVPVNFEAFDPADMNKGLSLPDASLNQQKGQGQENVTATAINTLTNSLSALSGIGVGQVVNEGVNLARSKNNKTFIRDGQKIIFISASN
jgi:hypothetical protein